MYLCLKCHPTFFALDVDIVTYCVCVFFLYRKYRRSIVEFPAESGDNVLHGRPEQRGGNVQQRIARACAGGVSSSSGREGSTERILQIPSTAGYKE